MRVLHASCSETVVTLLQSRDCIDRRHNWVIGITRISGSSELDYARQTDRDQAKREVCTSHFPILSVDDCDSIIP
jgi:hypothetical protein